MTSRQETILNRINARDTDTFNIHSDFGYAITPNSINPCEEDLTALVTLGEIVSWERIKSRVVKVVANEPNE